MENSDLLHGKRDQVVNRVLRQARLLRRWSESPTGKAPDSRNPVGGNIAETE
ncbi:MAG: hypothetical protein JNM56_08260 [Planctomycetia bacterium]|nr:hypothetical protein [Planctomycetia bacterium]